jgi:flavodoxin
MELKEKFGKSLIIYYSRGGKTRIVADKIAEFISADIYDIKPKNPPSILTAARYPIINKIFNKVKAYEYENQMPDLSQYDSIFVGAPVYAFTMPTVMFSFLSQTDFCSKKVISFATYGGNAGSFFEDFKQKAKNANFIKGAAFEKAKDEDIKNWLEKV